MTDIIYSYYAEGVDEISPDETQTDEKETVEEEMAEEGLISSFFFNCTLYDRFFNR